MVPGMDLQSQYDQVKQDSIGKSQQETLRDLRRNQTTNPNTDWSSRGVSGFRGAGYQEVNPSQMPTMDADTREILSPILGTYKEGGQTKEGYYGADNPYTLEGALKYAHNAGFDPADQTLDSQVRQSGGKLPSLFGTSLANNAARVWGEDYGNYQNQLQQQQMQQQQQNPYANFVPGQDYGDWKWTPGSITGNWLELENAFAAGNGSGGGGAPGTDAGGNDWGNAPQDLQELPYSSDGGGNYMNTLGGQGSGKDWATEVIESLNVPGAGYWQSANKDLKEAGIMQYRPDTGTSWNPTDDVSTFNKIMPSLTLAAMAAMSGGAAAAATGGTGAAVAGAARFGATPIAMGAAQGYVFHNFVQDYFVPWQKSIVDSIFGAPTMRTDMRPSLQSSVSGIRVPALAPMSGPSPLMNQQPQNINIKVVPDGTKFADAVKVEVDAGTSNLGNTLINLMSD